MLPKRILSPDLVKTFLLKITKYVFNETCMNQLFTNRAYNMHFENSDNSVSVVPPFVCVCVCGENQLEVFMYGVNMFNTFIVEMLVFSEF